MKYYIEHNQYTNEMGKASDTYYRVYHMRKFLGLISYKKFASETNCGSMDCYTSPICFKSEEMAETFIKDVLCAGIKTDNTFRVTVKEIECNRVR